MTVETDVEGLLARVQLLEDEREVRRVIRRYGPSVDSGSSAAAAALWLDDGVYDMGKAPGGDELRLAPGRAALTALFDGDFHQTLIAHGAAHVTSDCEVQIDGDTAVAYGYTFLFKATEDAAEFAVIRVMATRFDFVRSSQGWRIQRRSNRNLSGDEDARALFRTAALSWSPAS
ncbi:MAG: nuclear transport factor 2 family protein [Actinomycetota bacterium]|nr:MAG: nuclear transport factor 2 family protein [Actinomycetota bacterium]